MFHMTRYHTLLNFRERTMVFWTLAFPLLLGIFFYFGIGGVDDASSFEAIPVAVLAEETEDSAFLEFLEGISGELIEPEYDMTPSEAKKALSEGKIQGIFDNTGEESILTLEESGIEESILKACMDGYLQQTSIASEIQEELQEQMEEQMQSDPAAAAETAETLETLADSLQDSQSDFVQEVSLGGREVSSVTPYYFALVAMACLYMCFLGETAAERMQANLTEMGKRISVSPVHRFRMVLSNGISAYVIALVNMALILLFLLYVVKGLDISAHPGYAILTCMMGCLIGVTFGIFIESIGSWNQKIKTAILIGSSIFCAFLAGLMISTMKDIIEKSCPIVNRINPAALIADSLYCICVYDDMARLRMNLILMGVISVLFLVASWLMTRRVRYDSL